MSERRRSYTTINDDNTDLIVKALNRIADALLVLVCSVVGIATAIWMGVFR